MSMLSQDTARRIVARINGEPESKQESHRLSQAQCVPAGFLSERRPARIFDYATLRWVDTL
jgi:hypothetical protein